MTATGAEQPPSYELIDEIDTAGLKVAVVRTALELDVFSAVTGGAATIADLADATGCSPRGMAVLVRALRSLGLLELHGDRLHCSDTAAAYLAGGSPGYAAPIYLTWFRNRDRLTEAVRAGGGPGGHSGDGADSDWRAYASPDLVRWPARAATIPQRLADQGLTVGPGAQILDLGCGSGIIGFALARAIDGVGVVSVDRAGVLPVTARLAEAMGVGDRVTLTTGDADGLDLEPGAFDVILLVNVAQYLDDSRLLDTLSRSCRALRPGGQMYLACPVIDEGTPGNTMNWGSAVEMFLASGVDQRTEGQIIELLARAGFAHARRSAPNAFVAA